LNGRYTVSQILRVLSITLFSLSLVTWYFIDSQGTNYDPNQYGLKIHPAIERVWQKVDGKPAAGDLSQAWGFGPEPISITTEYYRDSPTGIRHLYYYDKGRLDILNPSDDSNGQWFVTGAVLVTEMLSGDIQLGTFDYIHQPLSTLQIVGDYGQPDAVTFASLAPLSSVWDPWATQAGFDSSRIDPSKKHADKSGQTVTDWLLPNGAIVINGYAESDVTIGNYDTAIGHNVAAPFAVWASQQAFPSIYLLGLPITEPYWFETHIDGVPTLLLIQAF
jgi:hypothetical protein